MHVVARLDLAAPIGQNEREADHMRDVLIVMECGRMNRGEGLYINFYSQLLTDFTQ